MVCSTALPSRENINDAQIGDFRYLTYSIDPTEMINPRVMIGKEDTDLCSQLSSLIGFRKNEIILFHLLSLPQFIYSEKSVQIFRLQNFFSETTKSFLRELCFQLSSLIGFRKKELIVFNSKKLPPFIYLETSVKIFRVLNLTCYFLKKKLWYL